MRRFSLFLLSAFVTLPILAHAQPSSEAKIWSCRDSEGRTTVTNLPEDTRGKQCRVIRQSRVQVVPAPTRAAAAPAAPPKAAPTVFPKEDAQTRASARSRQREILEQELAQEETSLEKARKDLAEQESVRYGDERNYARVLDRLQPYKDAVRLHEKNVESLKQELANLSR